MLLKVKMLKTAAIYLITLTLLFAISCGPNPHIDGLSKFWLTPKMGANIFNREVKIQDLKAAKAYGINYLRLAPDKFSSQQRDFLIGDADEYQGLVSEDLALLRKVLDQCHQEQLPVVITMLSLPGSRWRQQNNGNDDLRIWLDEKYQLQSAKFWRDLAKELNQHPSVVGYNILNEPHPEKLANLKGNNTEVQELLYSFYSLVIKNIREVDTKTTIIIDSSDYAHPHKLKSLKAHEDDNILYSFHMYDPFMYTNKRLNDGKYSYPGNVENKYWHYQSLDNYLSSVTQFQVANNITSNRILVGEYGGNRQSLGLENYLADLISIFNKYGWHHSFYAFREDTWHGMDYEIGSKKLPWSYWQDIEQGKTPEVNRNPGNKLFKVILQALGN
ncbi:MAG: cellulase family glycosylhydrolase [Pseudomonadota bacterium]